MLGDSLTLAGEMAWYLPFLIFFARICDVSLGTVRMILVIGGHPWISAVLGFFEVVIWVLAVGGVLAFLTNPFALLGYAGGFAVGVSVGMSIENRLALGYRVVRAISATPGIDLSERLRERGHRVTRVDGKGREGPVELAFMVVRRRELATVRHDIEELDPRAFLSVSHADRPSAAALAQDLLARPQRWLSGTSMRK